MFAKLTGVTSQPFAMPFGIGITRFHAQPQAAEHRLGIIELVRIILQFQQGLDARKQLFRKNRLIQEVVRPSFDAADLVFAVAQPGNHHHRDQTRSMILFPLPAKFIAGSVRHDDVQQDQVRRMLPHLGFRLAGVIGGDHVVAAPRKQLLHQQRVVLVVIHHEDAR